MQPDVASQTDRHFVPAGTQTILISSSLL